LKLYKQLVWLADPLCLRDEYALSEAIRLVSLLECEGEQVEAALVPLRDVLESTVELPTWRPLLLLDAENKRALSAAGAPSIEETNAALVTLAPVLTLLACRRLAAEFMAMDPRFTHGHLMSLSLTELREMVHWHPARVCERAPKRARAK
jgi:hypothetical protein